MPTDFREQTMSDYDTDKAPVAAIKMGNFIRNIIRANTISLTPARQTAMPCRNNKCAGFIIENIQFLTS